MFAFRVIYFLQVNLQAGNSVADPGFPVGENSQGACSNLFFCKNFAENCMKMDPPMDPPLDLIPICTEELLTMRKFVSLFS